MYAGGYATGLREGAGALRTAANTTYAGQWLAGKRHGTGTMSYADGGSYMGSWKYGKRHGHGTFFYAKGDTYAGAWHAGVKHGTGVYTANGAGCVYEGTWKHGKLLASKLSLNSMAGAAYYGAFDEYGRPTGAGAFAFGNGVSLSGRYEAPPVDEAEGDEAPVVGLATWLGSACGTVEGTTDAAFKKEFTTVKPTINVIIAGAPASGKGTQAEKIVEQFGLYHLSTGDLLRAAAEDPDNEVGQQAKLLMDEGQLVPDEIMLALVSQKLDDPKIKEGGWLLDGFPRTEGQAKAMESYFLTPTKVVLIDVPDEVLKERVCGRRQDPETGTIYHMTTNPPLKEDGSGEVDEEIVARLTQRSDDTEETLVKRLETFASNRDAVAATFASIAKTIDGNRDPAEVYAEVAKFIAE